MKIGTCIRFKSMESLEDQLITLKKYGFSTCQLLAWEPELWTDENAVTVRELFEKYEVTISAFWCGWEGPKVWNFYDGQLTLGLVPPDFRAMRVKNLCDGADFAKKLGVTDVVTHMGFIPENPYDPNFATFCVAVRTVAQHLQANGQYLLFETGQETPVAMLRCFEAVGTDNLAVNLDTANLILYGKANPVDSLDVFGKYVRNIHAKDGFYPTNGHSLGKEVKLGTGKVDFPAFFRGLKELGYDSHVTIEYEVADDDHLQVVLDSRDYLQKIIDEVYGK
ncbi:MAG: sugar phosphate isomerase/epimerase [Clostridia bacterium]|nr:sugar phosphate isomerase/epimerase [Clostridia bacterium]